MPLTYIEWLKVNKHPNTTAGEIIIEAYAEYYHAELSRPPKDVVEAINSKYPIKEGMAIGMKIARRHNRTAALHGASLAGRMEAVRFAEWAMNNNYVPDVIEKKHWLSDFDAPNGVEPYTTEQLYSLFKKESNG